MSGLSAMTHADVSPEEHHWETCPVCLDARPHDYVSFEQLSFVRCPECDTVYKSRERQQIRGSEFYEEDYFHNRASGRDRRFNHRVAKSRRLIRRAFRTQRGLAERVARGAALVDVGCSFGYVLEAGRQLGFDVTGVDVSQYAVKVCRERGYAAEVGALENLPLADQSTDVMVMRHVLEHTPDPRNALSEVTRTLRTDGRLVVIVPNLAYWKGKYRRKQGRYFRPDDLGQQHYVYYTQQSLARLVRTCGFEVLRTSRYGWGRSAHLGERAFHASGLCKEIFLVARPG